MAIRWTTAFLDRPAATIEVTERFWLALTQSTPSTRRGDRQQFVTLVPPDGDAYLRAQVIEAGTGGCHLDLHVEDITQLAARAIGLGAVEVARDDDVIVLRSPAGLVWCAVPHRREAVRPAPVRGRRGTWLVDQLCIDIPRGRFDDECRFWSTTTGWPLRASTTHPEFASLQRPDGMPLRLLLQRRDDDDGPARAHLDLSSDGVDAVVADHEELGATVLERRPLWTVLSDPSGMRYCVTVRNPWTGVVDPAVIERRS